MPDNRFSPSLQMITLGGDAELELVDSLDPFSEVGLTGAREGRVNGRVWALGNTASAPAVGV